MITPSHNPPEDGGIKYNPPNGGPADTNVTKVVEDRANALLADGLKGVKRISLDEAMASGHVKEQDLVQPFVEGLADIVDMAAIQKAGLTLGVDPLGGSGIEYWKRIGEYYNLNLTIVNDQVDQTFRFMHLDKDGAIRMDCSSECAMAGLLALRDKFDLAFANDPDYDRHGIVTPAGLMNPNHYLAVAINYLFQHRPQWGKDVAVGKTLVSSAMIDRVVNDLGRKLVEVPVGFQMELCRWSVRPARFCFLAAVKECMVASFLLSGAARLARGPHDKDSIIRVVCGRGGNTAVTR